MKPTDENVESVYDSIAESWYNLRGHTFAIFNPEKYASTWPKGKLLDVGCGVANYSLVFAKHGFDCVGVDMSKQMLSLASQNIKKNGLNFPLIKSNCLNLPFRDKTFDYVISIAVFHHLDSKEKRLKAFKEVYRVLRPGGTALITAWNKTQPKFILGKRDIYVKWVHKGEDYYRYYHPFTYGEMQELAKDTGFKIIRIFPEDSYKLPFKMFSKNVCILLKKDI